MHCKILSVFISKWLYSSFLVCELPITVFCDEGIFWSFFFPSVWTWYFVMPILFFICHEDCYRFQIHATVWKTHFLFSEEGARPGLMPKTSLKNSFKSPLCSCEHCSASKWGHDLLCQAYQVSVLPARMSMCRNVSLRTLWLVLLQLHQ